MKMTLNSLPTVITKISIYIFFALFSSTLIIAGDTSQWRGPDRDGKYKESGLQKKWPKRGAELKWYITDLGDGYSSPAVTDELIILTGMKDKRGFVFAYSHDAKPVWTTEYGDEWTRSYEGTRTTPTIVNELTYISGAAGDVTCLKTETGKIVWQKNIKSEYDAKKIRWGLTESLLVHGDMVISTPGGENNMIAFNRFTGEQIWVSKGSKEASAYCSPMIVNHGGSDLIITMTAKSIIGIDAGTGELYWKFPHKTDYDIHPNTPYYKDGKLYCVSGYGTGGVQLLLSPDGKSVTEVWRNKTLDSQMDGFIVHENYIYGTSHKKPAWHCLDWETGKEMWVDPGIGKGNVIFADGLLYSYAEDGTVGLIDPSPQGFNLLSSFKIFKGTNQHWAHPVISNGVLYIRHGDTLLAYKIKD